MRSALAVVFVFALGAAASAQSTSTVDQVKKLIAAGVGDDVILTFLASRGPIERLSADDAVALKAAGASDALLKGLIEASATPPAAPAPAPAPVAEPLPPAQVVSTTTLSLPASWSSYGPRTSYIGTVVPPGAVYYVDPTPCYPRSYGSYYTPPCPTRSYYQPPCPTTRAYSNYGPQFRSISSRYSGYRGSRCR